MKKKLFAIIVCALICAFVIPASVSAKKEEALATAVFTLLPKMTCQNCVKKVKGNLRFEKGVKEITTDLKTNTVTIKYEPSATGQEALVKAFKKIGYTATPAPQAK